MMHFYHTIVWSVLLPAAALMAAGTSDISPRGASGTFVAPDGSRYTYRSEYWGNDCVYERGVASAHGLHDEYLDAYWRTQEADSPESLLNTVTMASRPVFGSDEAVTRLAAHNAEQNKKKTPEQRRAIAMPEQFYFSVLCEDAAGTAHIFFAMTRGSLQKLELAPKPPFAPFDIQVVTRENGVWKLDLKQHSNPVLQELEVGAWKQFGAPSDIGDPAAFKEQRRKAAQQFEAAATRPARPRRSTTRSTTSPAKPAPREGQH